MTPIALDRRALLVQAPGPLILVIAVDTFVAEAVIVKTVMINWSLEDEK